MKKQIYLFASVIFIGIISLIIYSCTEKQEDVVKQDNPIQYLFLGFDDNQTHEFRSLNPDDTTESYIIIVEYNNGTDEVDVSINTGNAAPGDIVKTFLLVKETVTTNSSGVHFTTSADNDNVWFIEFGSYMVDETGGGGGVGCDISCYCPDWLQEACCLTDAEWRDDLWCWDCFCIDCPDYPCNARCEAISTVANVEYGPGIFIQYDQMRFNNTLYN